MARLKNKKTASKRYWLNALLLILPVVFIYQSFNPEFPASLPETQAGDFTLTAMPYDEDKPYQHDGLYVKDFLVMFQEGGVDQIRQGFLNIGDKPLPIEEAQQHELGILHGTRHGQHVHGLAQERITAGQKIWVTLQTWDGEIHQGSWEIPAHLISDV